MHISENLVRKTQLGDRGKSPVDQYKCGILHQIIYLDRLGNYAILLFQLK